jgi:hypothetical protein
MNNSAASLPYPAWHGGQQIAAVGQLARQLQRLILK